MLPKVTCGISQLKQCYQRWHAGFPFHQQSVYAWRKDVVHVAYWLPWLAQERYSVTTEIFPGHVTLLRNCDYWNIKRRSVNETLAYETETFGFWSKTRPRPSCNSTRPRCLIFATRRDRDVFRDLQPSALCRNNEWRTCLSWCHKQLIHCNCNCSVHYHEIYSPHKH